VSVDLELLPIGLDTSVDVTKHLKSLEVTGVFLNELSELDRFVLDFFTGGRLPRYPRKIDFADADTKYWSGMICDTNPPSDDSWIYNLFEIDSPQGYRMFVQPPAVIKTSTGYILNPECEGARYIVNGAEEIIKMTYGKSENFIKVYLMGEYGTLTDEKLIYYNYNDNIHSVDKIDIDAREPLILAADLGTVAPTMLLSQIVGGQVRVLKEFCGQFMTIRELCQNSVLPYFKQWCAGMKLAAVIHDPADTYDGADQLREFFHDLVIPAETNNIERRIDAVAMRLNVLVKGQGGLIISRQGCPQLRKGFNGLYYYRRLRIIGEERYTEEPHKNHPYSDCQDSLQYTLLWVNKELSEPESNEFSDYEFRRHRDKANRITGY
jgi:hypothetical protein